MIPKRPYFASTSTWHLWLCVFLIFSASCKEKTADDGKYSAAFMPVLDSVNKIFDTDPDRAVRYLDSAFNQLNQPNISDRFRVYGLHFVYQKKLKHDYNKALLYADSMMLEANKSLNKDQYAAIFAESNFAKGDAYFELKQFNDAYQYYYQGYLTGKQYLNSYALADYTYRMGMIMYKKGHYRLAANYFKASYKQGLLDRNDFPAFFRKQELLDNIGLSYKHSNQNDSALVYFNKTLQFLDQQKNNFPKKRNLVNMAQGVVYGNKADLYIQSGADVQAIDLLKKSIAINLQKGRDNYDAELTEIKLGQIYLKQNQTDSLAVLLTNLRRQLDTVTNADAEAGYARLVGNYYVLKDDAKKAIGYLQRYEVIKDSLVQKSNLLLESDVNQQLTNYEKQHEIDTLSTDNKLKVIYLYVTIFLTIMAVVIIFLVYRNWTRSKKDVKTVNLLNQQINEQNKVLEGTLNELNNSSQEKDRILRTVAHDLRNPIGGIASLTALMAEDEYSDEQKELINLVKETSVNSLELINEILEATNIASVKLNLEHVDINSLVNNSVELLRFKAAEKGQKILFEPLPKQQELYISREKIWRVISNLVSNAIKFSPTGALINVKVFESDMQIIVSVADNGIGIPDKLKDQVFNMFTSAQRPGTAGEKSFGLGLSICRQIIEKHSGKIWFESCPETGTTFFISLPFTSDHTAADLSQKVGVPLS
ncbi:tetratricopeptide repeat-containing sensor histidine kinase [Mucilaginibacter glaciei]|uniref:histidine kinase n=1 Tax=Mucilaginibacter glaciei TaxID=2772109 RepID=A0A926NJ84_9SPHI|nr:HAMP domain-containing sensor histidine kinase [Mucilaginibacter glaciei]MBD1392226.1 HAMP domain-containing histidine kinase [Mucilaginibacter glaciei]